MAVWNIATVWPTWCVVCSGDSWQKEPCDDANATCKQFRGKVNRYMSDAETLKLSIAKVVNELRVITLPAAAMVWAAQASTPGPRPRNDDLVQRRCACALAAHEMYHEKNVSIPKTLTLQTPLRVTLEQLSYAVTRVNFLGGLQSIEQFAYESPGLTQALARPTVESVSDAWLKVSQRNQALDARHATVQRYRGYAAVRTTDKTHILKNMHDILHAAVHFHVSDETLEAAVNAVIDAEELIVLGTSYSPKRRVQRRLQLLAHHASHKSPRVMSLFSKASTRV